MDSSLPPFKIFSGTKSRYMAEEICKELGVELGSMKIEHFADGEFEVSFEESVRALASHAIMSDPATQRVQDCGLSEIIFTNSIPYNHECSKCTIISVARLFADTINRVHSNRSISSQYLIK